MLFTVAGDTNTQTPSHRLLNVSKESVKTDISSNYAAKKYIHDLFLKEHPKRILGQTTAKPPFGYKDNRHSTATHSKHTLPFG